MANPRGLVLAAACTPLLLVGSWRLPHPYTFDPFAGTVWPAGLGTRTFGFPQWAPKGDAMSTPRQPHGPIRAIRGTRGTARSALATTMAAALITLGAPTADAGPVPATISVNTSVEAAADGLCSLREAVVAANINQRVDGCRAGSSHDLILLPAETYIMTEGALVFESSTVLRGYGAVVKRADGHVEPYWREAVVRVAATADVTISGVTVDGAMGRCTGLVNEGKLRMVEGLLTGANWGVPASCLDGAAALVNRGAATLLRTSLVNNSAELVASAFLNFGALRIVSGVISGNSSRPFQRFGVTFISENQGSLSLEGTSYGDNQGGSLRNSGTLTVRDSSFQGSRYGLWNEGVARVTSSSFTGNASGIRNFGSLRVVYSRIEGNINSGVGGPLVAGIETSGTLLLERSSVTGNRGTGTGGILSSGATTVRDSTIAENVAAAWFGPVGGTFNAAGAGGVTVTDGSIQFANVTLADNSYEPSPDDPLPIHFAGGL